MAVGVGRTDSEAVLLDAAWRERAETALRDRFGAPSPPGDDVSPHFFGDAWLWTGEQPTAPADWAVWGEQIYPSMYPHGDRERDDDVAVSPPWGLLWIHRAEGDRLGFDLHAAATAAATRDRFLVTSLVPTILQYVKADQSHRVMIEQVMMPRLNTEEEQLHSTITSAHDGLECSLAEQEAIVRDLTRGLLQFSESLSRLDEIAYSVGVATATVRGHTREAGPTSDEVVAHVVRPIDLLANQVRSDVVYFASTRERAVYALDGLRTLVEIEEARAQNRLAIVAVALGLAISVWQVPWDLPSWQRLVIGIILALAVSCGLYRHWSGDWFGVRALRRFVRSRIGPRPIG